MNGWPIVRLGDVLKHRSNFIEIDDLSTYKRCRVQLHAKGIVLRDCVPGAEIKTKRQQICRTGEFLVAEIDAKVGGYGIVPNDLEGAIVSSHYFLFVIDTQQLNIHFLAYYISTPQFLEQVSAQGSTNYAAIRPSHVLDYTIPLPSLKEQQSIVSRLDALNAKVNQASLLIRESDDGLAALCRSLLHSTSQGTPIPTPMSELVTLKQPDVAVASDQTYHFAGVYCFGRGVFVGQKKTGMEFAYPRLTRIHSGNFVYPKLMAWEGALAVVPPECDGLVVSTEYPVFEINKDRVLPEVLDVYFRSPLVWPSLSGSSTGTNVRRRRLNPSDFLTYQMPLPARPVQEMLRQVKHREANIKEQHKATSIEIAAMMPSILDRVFRNEL